MRLYRDQSHAADIVSIRGTLMGKKGVVQSAARRLLLQGELKSVRPTLVLECLCGNAMNHKFCFSEEKNNCILKNEVKKQIYILVTQSHREKYWVLMLFNFKLDKKIFLFISFSGFELEFVPFLECIFSFCVNSSCFL